MISNEGLSQDQNKQTTIYYNILNINMFQLAIFTGRLRYAILIKHYKVKNTIK